MRRDVHYLHEDKCATGSMGYVVVLRLQRHAEAVLQQSATTEVLPRAVIATQHTFARARDAKT